MPFIGDDLALFAKVHPQEVISQLLLLLRERMITRTYMSKNHSEKKTARTGVCLMIRNSMESLLLFRRYCNIQPPHISYPLPQPLLQYLSRCPKKPGPVVYKSAAAASTTAPASTYFGIAVGIGPPPKTAVLQMLSIAWAWLCRASK